MLILKPFLQPCLSNRRIEIGCKCKVSVFLSFHIFNPIVAPSVLSTFTTESRLSAVTHCMIHFYVYIDDIYFIFLVFILADPCSFLIFSFCERQCFMRNYNGVFLLLFLCPILYCRRKNSL